jgi:hypothetical protein
VANQITVDIQQLEQAGSDMSAAAATTREAVSNVVSRSQPVTGTPLNPEVTGSMTASDALYSFWYSLQEQLTLSGEVFDELGQGITKDVLTRLPGTDRKNASVINNSIGKSPAPPTPKQSTTKSSP